VEGHDPKKFLRIGAPTFALDRCPPPPFEFVPASLSDDDECCCVELDRTDLLIYEEVARMPPFQRKTLVLLGAKSVGRRTLKQRLVKADPSRFAGVVPCTL